jgi:hypothetical protein
METIIKGAPRQDTTTIAYEKGEQVITHLVFNYFGHFY